MCIRDRGIYCLDLRQRQQSGAAQTAQTFQHKKGTDMMKEKLTKILEDALGQIDRTEQLEHLNDVKVAFLGKKGELTSVLKSMKDVAPEDRPKVDVYKRQCYWWP